MKVSVFASCLFALSGAVIEKELEIERVAIPPGVIDIPLNFLNLNNNLVLVANVSVGSNNVSVPFIMSSTTPNIVLSNDTPYNPSTSLTYVPVNGNGPADVYGPDLTPYVIFGQEGYEFFNFSGITIHGQGFLLGNQAINASRMGFSFNKTDDPFWLGYPVFVDKLHQEAQLPKRVINFAVDFNVSYPYDNGVMTLGMINPLFFPFFVNYSVTIPNGNWAFGLTNIAYGDVGLGANGFVTINTNSPGHFVPVPVMESIVSRINAPSTRYTQGEAIYNSYACSALNFNTLPNVTYYLDNKPLILTPYQYILNYSPVGGPCILGFVGSHTIDPINAAYTLGTMLLNSSVSFFDFDAKVFGITPSAVL